MKFPTYEEMGQKVAEKVLDAVLINGKTLREWVHILSDELSILDKIRSEITEYKDDKIIHAERNEMIDIVLDIIDKYRVGSEGIKLSKEDRTMINDVSLADYVKENYIDKK